MRNRQEKLQIPEKSHPAVAMPMLLLLASARSLRMDTGRCLYTTILEFNTIDWRNSSWIAS
jgi:hypothetical protein